MRWGGSQHTHRPPSPYEENFQPGTCLHYAQGFEQGEVQLCRTFYPSKKVGYRLWRNPPIFPAYFPAYSSKLNIIVNVMYNYSLLYIVFCRPKEKSYAKYIIS